LFVFEGLELETTISSNMVTSYRQERDVR
jgi:hypothetical protein